MRRETVEDRWCGERLTRNILSLELSPLDQLCVEKDIWALPESAATWAGSPMWPN